MERTGRSGDHWVSTSRGPPSDAIDAFGGFKASFGSPTLPPEMHAAELGRAEPPFTIKRVRDLVPDATRDAYDAACR